MGKAFREQEKDYFKNILSTRFNLVHDNKGMSIIIFPRVKKVPGSVSKGSSQ